MLTFNINKSNKRLIKFSIIEQLPIFTNSY